MSAKTRTDRTALRKLANVTPLGVALIDPLKLRCIDCNGWPLNNGAVFVAVFVIRSGQAELGGICELCWLKRLERRGKLVNATSTMESQIALPQLGLVRREIKLPRRS